MDRRSVLKIFGVGVGAAVSPAILAQTCVGAPPAEIANLPVEDFAVLVVTEGGVIWGPCVNTIKVRKEFGVLDQKDPVEKLHDILHIEFKPWKSDRCIKVLGCHLIHKPTHRKFDYREFHYSPVLTPGDSLIVSYSTPAALV